MVVFTKLENQFTRICFHYLIGDSRESELVKALVKRNSREMRVTIILYSARSDLGSFTIGVFC